MTDSTELGGRDSQIKLIIITGAAVGVVFSIVGDPQPNINLFVALVSVQGSFLAIAITLMILSIQITAEEYSSMSIRDIQDAPFLNILIMLFVSSILLDVFYILTIEQPIYVINTDLSISAGLTTMLATICLLSLVPGRYIMTESVAPERILESAKENLDSDDIPSSSFHDPENPPKRNPLATIEQVLVSGKKRDDESTVRQAIYEMTEGTKKLIKNTNKKAEEINETALFECLDSCDDAAIKGGYQRTRLAVNGHSEIACESIQNNLTSLAKNRLEALRSLFAQVNDIKKTEARCLNDISRTAITSEDSDSIDHISNTMYQIVSHYDYADGKRATAEPIQMIAVSPLLNLIACIPREVFEAEDDRMDEYSTSVDCLNIVIDSMREDDDWDSSQTRSFLRDAATGATYLVTIASRTGTANVSESGLKLLIELTIVLDRDEGLLVSRLNSHGADMDNLIQTALKYRRRSNSRDFEPEIGSLDVQRSEFNRYIDHIVEQGSRTPGVAAGS